MYLLFFVSRLRVEPRTKAPVTYLRFKAATDGCEDVDFNEGLLNSFCFPLGPDAVQPKEVQASEEYTFTLTHSNGQRFTGFCRQIFPPAPRVGSKARYPQVLCIVAENPWCNFFFKVLQVAEQILKGGEGLLDTSHKELPLDSHLGSFLVDLRKQLGTNPAPGEVLKVSVPNLHGLQGVSPPRYMASGGSGEALDWSGDRIELQVPPDCGNGKGNSGIPLARLLFHVPVEGMLTLVASLLLERRILFVARSRDTVTAAVQAAQALIYPFKWHHIYLPILPRDLVDYLTAPMPFLVGLTSEMLPSIRHIPMSEVTTVDLDLQKVIPPPGEQQDDGRALPYGRLLGSALDAVFKTVRSPTEYESSPVITGVMQEYFVRLFGSYRRFIHDQAMEPLLRAAQAAPSSSAVSSRGAHGGRESGRSGREGRGGHLGGSGHDGAPSPQGSSSRLHDDMLRGHGYYFDQPAFVAHRRSESVRSFLNAMRHSQLYQMFIMERLEMAAAGVLDLPACASATHSFSFSTVGSSRALSGMSKCSSMHNLSAFEKPLPPPQAAAVAAASPPPAPQLGGAHAPLLSGFRDLAGEPSTSGSLFLSDPFELRVQRHPEQRRLLREHVRSVIAELAPGAGGGKLASKLRRHRRTDSEDLYSQGFVGGSLHAADSIRRITTYPGLIDVSTPSLSDPSSFFVEWDMHDDDDEAASASPSPSPRGPTGYTDRSERGHMRSESGNSLYSADSGEAAGPSGVQPPAHCATSSFAFPGRGGGGGRDRDSSGHHDSTPLRRLSVSVLTRNEKATYTSLRARTLPDSTPGPSELPSGPQPASAGAATASGGAAGNRMAAFGSLFAVNGADAAVAATVVRSGVQVKTLADGHRVYDGNLKDLVRMGAAEAKNVLSTIAGLASPNKLKEREAAVDRQGRNPPPQQQRQLHAPLATALQSQPQQVPLPPFAASAGSQAGPSGGIPLPGMPTACVQTPLTSGIASSSNGPAQVGLSGRAPALSTPSVSFARQPDDLQQRSDRFTSLLTGLTGLKDKVAGAGTKALGILHTPHYKPQTTGERAAKFKAQLTGGGGASLLAGADGKLKQPHAPQRPLSVAAAQQPPWARSEGEGASGSSHAASGGSWGLLTTPAASPAAPGTPISAPAPTAAPEVSPFAQRSYHRAQSLDGQRGTSGAPQGPSGNGGSGGDVTPPTVATAHWRGSDTQLLTPSDWDPFGIRSAPPAVGNCSSAGSDGALGTTATSATPSGVPACGNPPGALVTGAGTCPGPVQRIADSATADFLGLSSEACSNSAQAFDPFAVGVHSAVAAAAAGLPPHADSGGSNDYTAFASARDFPSLSPIGSASLLS